MNTLTIVLIPIQEAGFRVPYTPGHVIFAAQETRMRFSELYDKVSHTHKLDNLNDIGTYVYCTCLLLFITKSVLYIMGMGQYECDQCVCL